MQQPPKLIAIHGLKGSGKDLTAKILRKYVLNSDGFAFGTRLKQICSVAWDVPLSKFHSEYDKERTLDYGLSPRDMMTRIQGPLKAEFGEDFFAKSLREAWKASLIARNTLVVTDLRFPVELQLCRDLGAVVVHVQRPPSGLYTPSVHASEQGLPIGPVDTVLDNSKDRAHLMLQVRVLVLRLWGANALHSYPFVDSDCVEF
jgi:hypothetical protein